MRLNQPVFRSTLLPALVVAALYAAFTLAALARHGWDPHWFVWIGSRFAAADPQGNTGYDGQFVYYIARDGLDAVPYLDLPAYRLQRIGLPLLVGLLAFGSGPAVAWLLIAVNYAAVVGGTALLARWLAQRRVAPAWALLYGGYVGTFLAFSRDLTEPLAYGLTIAAMLAWHTTRPRAAVALFALAVLTKEPTLLFPAVLGIAAVLSRDWRRAGALLLVPLPWLAWQVFLLQRLGTVGLGLGSSLQPVPLGGIIGQLTTEPGRLSGFLFVALPALGLLLAALWGLRGDSAESLLWLVVVHAVFVLLLPPDVYDHIMHAGRNATGLVVATVLALPLLPRPTRVAAALAWVAPTAVWLLPVLRWAPWLQTN